MNRYADARSKTWTLQYEAGNVASDGMVVRLDANFTDLKVKGGAAPWSFDTPAGICSRGFLDLFSIYREKRHCLSISWGSFSRNTYNAYITEC